MGKVGRWLRSFLNGKKVKDKGDADGGPSPSTGHASTPAAKEKRRWSFRRPAAAASVKDTGTSSQSQLASTSSHCFLDVHVVAVQDQRTVAPAAVVAAASKGTAGGDAEEERAAVRIQSAFRSYLARKALCALRGMVKLQAMVRGQLVRRQADMTLRCIEALVAAQRRARAERLRLLEDGRPLVRTPRPRSSRRSPQHHDNVRIVEVDDGGGARGSSSCSTPARVEPCQKASPTASGMTSDGSARTLSGRFEDHSASFSAASEASGRRSHRHRHRHHGAADHHAAAALLFPRNYMANTESSRAKARSQSAPRHRPTSAGGSDAASALPSPSPSPSCERPPSGSAPRRRASLDPRDLATAPLPRSSDAARVERCASQARAGAASPAGSECGSSSRGVVTSAAAARIA